MLLNRIVQVKRLKDAPVMAVNNSNIKVLVIKKISKIEEKKSYS